MATRVMVKTVPALRRAIKEACEVRVQVRFGVSEYWVKLAKNQAFELIEGMRDSMTPSDFEMYDGDSFGEIKGSVLYLG